MSWIFDNWFDHSVSKTYDEIVDEYKLTTNNCEELKEQLSNVDTSRLNKSMAPTELGVSSKSTDKDGSFTITLTIPGVKRSDLSLSHSGQTLVVKWKFKGKSSMRIWGVNEDQYKIAEIDAKYEDGILTIKVPAQPTAIKDTADTLSITIK